MSSQGQTNLCESLRLTEGHLSILMKILVGVSDKWQELGIALGLPGHVLNDCRESSNVISLANILREWIKGSHPSITLKTLKLELEGPLVGRPVVAQDIMKSFNTTVNRPPAAMTQESLLTGKKHLTDLYSVSREIPADTWPPVGAATFINLALIDNTKQGTDNYNYSLRGDLDDVLASKEKIEYDKVFGRYESGALVLVEGRPGSGKTTLVHKVTKDWATTGNALSNANVVFLIPLRSLAQGNDESLSGILSILYRRKEAALEKVCGDICLFNGEGVCFILDGLDEYKPQDNSKSVIYDLLKKTYLPKAMVIVSSRPAATSTLRREAPVSKRIEVLGFTREQIFEYIDKFPFSAKASNLRAYLHSHQNILHMCYLPVHTAMICYLYKQEQGNIPATETKIYEHFTRYIILRQQRRTNRKAQLHSLEDLCGKNKEYFRKICRLAFDMTIDSKQVILKRVTEVPLSDDTGLDDSPSLGFVTIDITAQQYGLDNVYSFLHLTFQEYLTATHLATLTEEEQVEIIRLHAGENHMKMVWKFYCGMVGFAGKVAQVQLIMMNASPLYRAQCAMESQQGIVCDHAVSDVLNFHGFTLTPADLTAVGYTISVTSHDVTQLAMRSCDLSDDRVGIFMKEVGNSKRKCLISLDLSYNDKIGEAGAQALAEALKSCCDLQTLILTGNNIGSGGAKALAESVRSCNNLQRLDLSWNNIGTDGAQALADGLKSCCNLQTLSLYNNYIGDDGTQALAGALHFCCNLLTLDLRRNNIGDYGARALAEALLFCNKLQTLYLSKNNIGHDGAQALAEGLKSCHDLQTLHISDNNIVADGAQALAETLKSYKNLQSLDFSFNKIGDAGARALADLECHIPDTKN